MAIAVPIGLASSKSPEGTVGEVRAPVGLVDPVDQVALVFVNPACAGPDEMAPEAPVQVALAVQVAMAALTQSAESLNASFSAPKGWPTTDRDRAVRLLDRQD